MSYDITLYFKQLYHMYIIICTVPVQCSVPTAIAIILKSLYMMSVAISTL